MCWLNFGIKRSKVKVTAGGGIIVDDSPLSSEADHPRMCVFSYAA